MSEKEISVLHISTPTSWRGGEQQVQYLIDHSFSNISNFILSPKNSPLSKCAFKNTPQQFSLIGKGKITWIQQTKKIIQKLNPDVIHTHDSKAHTIALVALILSKKKAKLVVARRVDFEIGDNLFSRLKYDHPRVSAIVCVSKKIKEICARKLKRNQAKLHVIYDGVAPKTAEEKTELRKELKLNPETILVGCVAALAPHKDHITLLKAFQFYIRNSAIQPLHPHLVLIGEGPCRDEVEAFIEDQNLSTHVSVLGFRKDVPALLNELNLFCITSETEGLGTSIIDAMLKGLPIVATKAGGIPELINDGKTGLLCPVKDFVAIATALQTLIQDEALAKRLGQNAIAVGQKFSAQKMAEESSKLYANLLQ